MLCAAMASPTTFDAGPMARERATLHATDEPASGRETYNQPARGAFENSSP
jgi:hypothetical protein